MNQRLKELRKCVHLTQKEFADKLGIKRGAIANYEVGRNEPIDAVVSLICKEFNVNEEWFRTGNGEMFNEIDRENRLMIWTANVLKGESESFKKRFVDMLSELNESDWETLEKISILLHKND